MVRFITGKELSPECAHKEKGKKDRRGNEAGMANRNKEIK